MDFFVELVWVLLVGYGIILKNVFVYLVSIIRTRMPKMFLFALEFSVVAAV